MSWYGEALDAFYRQYGQQEQMLASGITGAASDISNAVKTAQQNQQANQLASQMDNSGNYAPRAALVSPGTNPITGAINAVRPGTNTQGSAPVVATGGVPGLELQMAVKKAQQEATGAGIENQLKQAQTGYYGAHARYMNAQPAMQRQQMQMEYKQQRDAQNDMEKNADTIPRLQKDIDDSYGQGTFQKFTAALSQDPAGASLRGSINTKDGKQYWIPNANGPLFSPEPPKPNTGWFGSGIGAGPGEMSGETTMPVSAFQGFMQRYQRITQSPTGRYVPPAGQGVSPGVPTAGGGAGGNGQIPTISDPNIAAKLPPNTIFRTPQGILKRVPGVSPAQGTLPGAIPSPTPAPNG